MSDPNSRHDPFSRFVATRCEAAFRELVDQYSAIVLGTARRRLNGNEIQAKEVAQLVFTEFARRAHTLSSPTVISAWLHRVTCAQSAMLVRSEQRRRHHEERAAMATEYALENNENDSVWRETALTSFAVAMLTMFAGNTSAQQMNCMSLRASLITAPL